MAPDAAGFAVRRGVDDKRHCGAAEGCWIMKLYLYGGLIALLIASHAWAFFSGRAGGKEDVQKEWRDAVAEATQQAIHERDAVQAAADAAATQYERDRAARAAQIRTLQQELKHALSADSVYRDCRLPADGLRIFRAARSAGTGATAR